MCGDDLKPCPFCKGTSHTEANSAVPGGRILVHDGEPNCPLRGAYIRIEKWQARQNISDVLIEALEEFCRAAEYWAGCDEGCDPDTASSEIMSSGGSWPACAYDKARDALRQAKGGDQS